MVSTFTPNIGLEEPARGDQVGTWDTPVNANMTLVDLTLGGTTVVPLTNANVVLSAAQYKCKTILFTGNLTGNCTITFPSTFLKSYEIFNLCTGNFVVLLGASGGGFVVSAPPGECTEILNLNGGGFLGIFFKSLGRIGSYMDIGVSTMPAWISNCSVPPYLNCDGSTFNNLTYPILTQFLGGTTLPDLRGRVKAYMNFGTGRLTSAGGGVDGNTLLAAGGTDNVVLLTSQIPSHSHANSLNDLGHAHNYTAPVVASNQTGGGSFASDASTTTLTTTTNGTGMTITNAAAGGGLGHVNAQPTAMAGLCLIRAG